METLLDIANNNRLKERQENVRLIIDKYFPNRLDSDHNYLANHELYLVVGLKKERIYHAKKLEELAVLRNKKQLYVGCSDCNYVGGSLEEIVLSQGYSSIQDYVDLAHASINQMYEAPIYHYSNTLTDIQLLKPLRVASVKSSTMDKALAFRRDTEASLGLQDCMYATTSLDMENIYGKHRLLVDSSKFDVLYHIGDTLENAREGFLHAQKPFKKGEYQPLAHRFIPAKDSLVRLGADALIYYGMVIEVLLREK